MTSGVDDRIARNGDTANKIGTFSMALACHAMGVPFYIAAPSSTIDRACPNGAAIPIEERKAEEVSDRFPAWNPAFDVTPAKYITGIITERGVFTPPFIDTLPTAFKDKDKEPAGAGIAS